MNRKTTKDKILLILKRSNDLSMKDIMEHFTISDIAVRKQIRLLIKEGFVKKRIVKQEVGRPYHVYSLTEKGHYTFPNHYADLSVDLLKDLEQLQGKEVVNQLLQKHINNKEDHYANVLPDDDFDQRIAKFVKVQESKGYMVEHNQTENGDYEIINFNCPIFNLASNYTQICDYEKDMFNNLFPESKIHVNECMSRGAEYCYLYVSRPKYTIEEKELEKNFS